MEGTKAVLGEKGFEFRPIDGGWEVHPAHIWDAETQQFEHQGLFINAAGDPMTRERYEHVEVADAAKRSDQSSAVGAGQRNDWQVSGFGCTKSGGVLLPWFTNVPFRGEYSLAVADENYELVAERATVWRGYEMKRPIEQWWIGEEPDLTDAS